MGGIGLCYCFVGYGMFEVDIFGDVVVFGVVV